MSKTERYDVDEDLYNDIKRHDNPNHQGHFKNLLNLTVANEQLQEYENGTDTGDSTDDSGASSSTKC